VYLTADAPTELSAIEPGKVCRVSNFLRESLWRLLDSKRF
jgi:hypothetical protein